MVPGQVVHKSVYHRMNMTPAQLEKYGLPEYRPRARLPGAHHSFATWDEALQNPDHEMWVT